MAPNSKVKKTTMKLAVITLVALVAAKEAATKKDPPPLVPGLAWEFYKSTCPDVEDHVRNHLEGLFKEDIGLAAGLLRLHFHDCFVQGCDASVLLEGHDSEQKALPNLTLRPKALKTIEELQQLIINKCGRVVSCADIIAMAARDSVNLTGGPPYKIPLGRRDSKHHATIEITNKNISCPNSKAKALLKDFSDKRLKLDATDLVALSGAHTIGRAHFGDRLYPGEGSKDRTFDKDFKLELKQICPTPTTDATTENDCQTPDVFDNKYYDNLVNNKGLFTSDEDLFEEPTTRDIVKKFAEDQSCFFEKFEAAMIKLGQLNVLTGEHGEVREKCSVRNRPAEELSSIVEEGEDQDSRASTI